VKALLIAATLLILFLVAWPLALGFLILWVIVKWLVKG
jgi:hypothetical protein